MRAIRASANSSMQITIDTTGLLRKVGLLRRIFQGRRILGIVADSQLKWIDQNFATQGVLFGGARWAANRPNTVAAKGHARVLQRTGALRRSFRAKLSIFAGGGRVQVGTAHKLAKFAEFGTRPHTIRPRRGKRLRFVSIEGTVFAQSVRHPGTPPRKMLPSRAVADRIAERALAATLRRDLGRPELVN